MEHPNHGMILRVLDALGTLSSRVVLVGGAVVDLYCDEKVPSWEVRPTKDIDVVTAAVTYGDLQDFETALYRNGFIQTAEDDVMCRFRYQELIVDIMSTKAIGWAPSNRWLELGFPQAESIQMGKISFKILPLQYFLAAKFAAFRSRGANDYRMSHDLEDIVTILNGRSDWAAHVLNADPEAQKFLVSEFRAIQKDPRLKDAILGNLPYQGQKQRFERILGHIDQVCDRLAD